MAHLSRIKEALLKRAKEEKSSEPLMNIEAIKSEMLPWLAELKLPPNAEVDSWEDLVQEFPAKPGDEEGKGLRVRLALRLCTADNKYLISIMECLDYDSRGVYLISAHVNWKADEKHTQKLVDEGYLGGFDDVLRAKHTLWAQTFRAKELAGALDSCTKAILSNELRVTQDLKLPVEPIPYSQPSSPRFPKPVDEDA